MEEKKGFPAFFSNFLHHGGAGVLAAVVIILIFLVCATWLRSLVFGLLLAFILLPVERFFQDKIFRSEKKGWLSRLRERITGKRLPDDEERKALRNARVFKSSLAAFITLFSVLFLVTFLAVSVLIPQVTALKDSVVEWGKKNPTVTKVEKYFFKNSQGKENPAQDADKNTFSNLRESIKKLTLEHQEFLSPFLLNRNQDLWAKLIDFFKKLGTLLLDVVLSIFFGFYFLQKIALFEGSGKARRRRFGEWFVNLFYNSPWLPKVSEKTRWQAVQIITHINGILIRWVRGYFSVIAIEFILYTLLFTAAGVPYALLAGTVADLSVLLPFFGPVISFSLTAGLCIAFCDAGLVMTLVVICVIYLLINGVLEQFFLYPSLIGEVSGLTTVETIIVVLVGGIVAGISGMIFAIPAAAIIKYLIPVVYRASSLETAEEQNQKNISEGK